MPDETVNVRELRPADTLALFYSIEDAPYYAVKLCAEATLHAAVHAVFYCEDLPRLAAQGSKTAEDIHASAAIADELRTKGAYNGGPECHLELGRGIEGVVRILGARVREAQADARFEDEERCKALRRAKTAEAALADLRRTLKDALGDQAAAVAAKAAEGGR